MPEPIAIIVGAGPSGLATSACLNRLSIPNIVLEREDCFASLWKKKSYDHLHLHLTKQYSELPHMSLPTTFPTYISKNQFIQYLDDYASQFNITPMYYRLVESSNYDEIAKKWHVKVRHVISHEVEEYSSRFLVVATGETSDEFIPEVEGLSSFTGEVFTQLSTRMERGTVTKVCWLLGLEILAWKSLLIFQLIVPRPLLLFEARKLRYGDLTKYGIQRPQEGPFTLKAKYGKYPVIDVGTYKKIKFGEIQVLPGIASIRGDEVQFENGKSHPFDAIVFATGFKRSTHKWLKGDNYLLDEDGIPKPSFPNHWKGENGLYCAGLARRGLYGAAMDAQKIANDIKSAM
ncbi:flavin-binding monooxygenase family protein [Actinidia rufa]|uniref:indole-3-pyruvate monooxygenase n=1 Tax=Actinidia rufa TaxID=165716 RepID=A0A7J0H9U0_9ERIC|nr:flavin-binding monooxygenase family protein [Actinidia rufa]